MNLLALSSPLIHGFQAVLEASWQGALAILLVGLVRRALGARLPARWRHALWLLVLARLLVPAAALPHSPASLQNVPVLNHPIEQSGRMLRAARDANNGTPNETTLPTVDQRFLAQGESERGGGTEAALSSVPRMEKMFSGWPLWRVAAWTWFAGVLACGGWVCAGVWWWRHRLSRNGRSADDSIARGWQACCVRLRVRRPPCLLVTDLVTSPALVGWLRPTLLIPERVPANFSVQDWEHVFLHEIAHLRRRDHWTQAVQLLVLCVHRFNPLVWVGMRALRADRELATDELALGWVQDNRTLGYGETLLKTLRAGHAGKTLAPTLAVGIMEEGASHLQERLRRIAAFAPGRATRTRGALGIAALGLLATVVLGQPTPAPAPTAADLALYAGLAPVDQLHAAASSNDLPMLHKLLDEGADPNAATTMGWERTALAIAANDDRLDAVKLLVEKGAKVNGGDGHASAALEVALRNGWTDCADYLLGQGAQCDPVFLAAAKGDKAAVDPWLAEGKASFDQLRVACEDAGANGQTELFARLYDAIRALPGKQGWDIDHGAIRRAVAHGHREVVAEMIRRDPNLGRSVLRLATAAAMSPGMREWLKNKGYDVSEADDNEWFIDAVDRDDIPQMRRWLAKGTIDVNYRGESGWTPLTKAAIAGRLAATQLLLAHKADPNLVRFPGTADYTPLCFAQSPAVADALLAGGADLYGKTYGGHGNAMSYALTFGPNEMVKWFLDHGLLPPPTEDDASSAKFALFEVSTAEMAEMLIAKGADVNAKNKAGETPLLHLVGLEQHAGNLARVLIKHGADPNFRQATGWQSVPLAVARDADTIDALIEGGADINAKDEDGNSLLCSPGGFPREYGGRFDALLAHGLKLDLEKEGARIMNLALAYNTPSIVRLLLDRGLNPDAVWRGPSTGKEGSTPLGEATENGHTELVRLLLDHGAKAILGREMEFAMTKGHADTVRLLWERGIRVTSELTYAVSLGAPIERLAKLLDGGSPVDPPEDSPYKPLAVAAALGNVETVKFLVERGANVDDPGWAIDVAAEAGRAAVVECLVSKKPKDLRGALFNMAAFPAVGSFESDRRGTAPIDYNRCAELLIQAGALDNISEDNAAHLLRQAALTNGAGGNPVILKMLFDHGLRVDSRFKSTTEPGAAAPAGTSDDGRTFLEMVEKRSQKGAGSYWSISPETLKVIEEAKNAQMPTK